MISCMSVPSEKSVANYFKRKEGKTLRIHIQIEIEDTLNKSYPTTENPIIYRFHIPFSTFFLYITSHSIRWLCVCISVEHLYGFLFPNKKKNNKKKFPTPMT